jgi:peptide-methionine (S)-S-oxide reductase
MKLLAVLPLLAALLTNPASAAETPKSEKPAMETVTIAGGCFWCLDATFLRVKGVEKVLSGYTGGKTKNPTYEQICTGLTGHAEAVQVTFDPKVITLDSLLNLFFQLHDPTTLNAQGPDHGTQYRSAIFYTSDAQKAAAEKAKKAVDASGHYSKPAVTEITALGTWYPAEDYHQGYFDEHMPKGSGNYGYLCRIVLPKVEKLKKLGVELKPVAKESDEKK